MKGFVKLVILVIITVFFIGAYNVQAFENAPNSQEYNETEYNKSNVDMQNEMEQMEDIAIEDMLDEIDDSTINEMLNEMFDEKISFNVMVKQLLNGETEFNGKTVMEMIKTVLFKELSENKNSLIAVFLLCVMSALFANFTKVLEKGSVAEIGFYIIYLLLIAILFRSFSITFEIASSLLTQMTKFMKVLLPAFFVTVVAAKGASTALIFYEFILMTIYIVEFLLLKFALPLCSMFVVINLINQISKEDLFSKMAELIKQAVLWIIKWLFAIVMGINAIHSILAPALDEFKNSVFNKTVSAIPGIGNTLGGVSDVVIGSGVLIKNGVGGAILILLALLICTPLLKLCCCMLMYKVTVALIQPVSDKRMVNMVGTVGDGALLLIKCVSSVSALFFLTMAILTLAAG